MGGLRLDGIAGILPSEGRCRPLALRLPPPPPASHFPRMPLARRRFDHLALELSLALSVRVPRLALYCAAARYAENGARLAEFCGAPLDGFLTEQRLAPLAPRARARLRRRVAHFDPRRRTPEEILGRMLDAERGA